MSFRFSKIPRSFGRSCSPEPVKDVVQRNFIDDKGNEFVKFVKVDNLEVTKSIPKPVDYSLENLLKAGVPLEPVNAAVLDDEHPSDDKIAAIVDSIDKDSNVENSK